MVISLASRSRAARPPEADAASTRETAGFRRLSQAPNAPCSALHCMGFFVPRRLLDGRWALTPPFHPYRTPFRRPGGIFSVILSVPSGFRRPVPRILRGMLPGSVRTFLCAVSLAAIIRPPSGVEDRQTWENDEGKLNAPILFLFLCLLIFL
jgi:hypothetical protein